MGAGIRMYEPNQVYEASIRTVDRTFLFALALAVGFGVSALVVGSGGGVWRDTVVSAEGRAAVASSNAPATDFGTAIARVFERDPDDPYVWGMTDSPDAAPKYKAARPLTFGVVLVIALLVFVLRRKRRH